MNLSMPVFAGVVLAAATLGIGAAAAPLRTFMWKSRVLVAAAPSSGDAVLLEQRSTFAAMATAAEERDLVLVEAVGDTPEANAIRTALDLASDRFSAVLVGKDGGVKLRSDRVLNADDLLPLIDAMPMRQEEARARTRTTRAHDGR